MAKVEIVDVSASRVVSAYGYGEGPEEESGRRLREFIRLARWGEAEIRAHRVFGFNNPDPGPGSAKYGYEHWITVEDRFELPADLPDGVVLKSMPGGLYASLESPGIPNPVKWGSVIQWLNGSEYQYDGSRQWLEEILMTADSVASFLGESSDPERWLFHLMAPVVRAAVPVGQPRSIETP